jgi:high affinity Mn2+ porin
MHDRGGLSLNLEQQIVEDFGVFARAGWSQGQYETFDFTDINKTVSFGGLLGGARWGRADDRLGLAFVASDASRAAKQFFAAGGIGILVGDGQLLHSGPEKIIETCYSLAAFSFARLSLDYQFIVNPPTTATAAQSRSLASARMPSFDRRSGCTPPGGYSDGSDCSWM